MISFRMRNGGDSGEANGNEGAVFCGKTQLESPEQSDLCSKIQTSRDATRRQLFAPERDDDLFVAAPEDDAAVFDSLDRHLVDLRPDLQTELLTFGHCLAVDDREFGVAIERDRTDKERSLRNFTLVGSSARNFSGRFPADRPKWTAR